jgi:hypothetical protein
VSLSSRDFAPQNKPTGCRVPRTSPASKRFWARGTLSDSGSSPSCLPSRWVAFAVKASNHHNPMLLKLEEYGIREAAHSRTAAVPVDERESLGTLRERLNGCLDRQRETLRKLRTNVGIPCPRFQQIFIGVGYPYDRERHGFLRRPDLTCSQGTTSAGFCSCRAIRQSSSARCASVSDNPSASRLSHTASKSSAFSAAERAFICSSKSFIRPQP